jgi:photosystem II stability/assembly factor-like uncharacterized protein
MFQQVKCQFIGDWEQLNGPIAVGQINTFATDGIKTFAGTNNAIYFSSNNGANWINRSMTTPTVASQIMVNGIYAFAISDKKLYRTSDDGITWTQLNSNGILNLRSIISLDSNLFCSTQYGIDKSSNNGDNWTKVYNYYNKGISYMCYSGNYIFACSTDTLGILVSTNDGTTWTPKNTGLTNLFFNCIYTDGSNIYTATQDNKLFMTTNNGDSWAQITSSYLIHAITKIDDYLYIGTDSGLFYTTNNGTDWYSVAYPELNNLRVNCLLKYGNNLYAGTDGDGLFLSTDDGSIWSPLNNGIAEKAFVKTFENKDNYLFAATINGGIYYTTNNGTDWTQSNNGMHSRNSQTILNVDGNLFAGAGNCIFFSYDNGATWNLKMTCNSLVTSLARIGVYIFAGTNGDGMYRSSDYGETWSLINTGITGSKIYIYSLTTKDSLLFAGSISKIYKSSNNGDSWLTITNGLPSAYYIKSLLVKNDNIFAGDSIMDYYTGFYKSTNNGDSWIQPASGFNKIYSMATSGVYLYAGRIGAGIYITLNEGSSWEKIYNFTDLLSNVTLGVHDNYLFSSVSNLGLLRRQIDSSIPIPSMPLLKSPLNFTQCEPTTIPFIWFSTLNATGYNFQVSTNSDFTSLNINEIATDTNYTPTILFDPGKIYYWRVRAFEDTLQYNWSSAWCFSTASTVPGYAITGSVKYRNTAYTPLKFVNLFLEDNTGNYVSATQSDSTGHYQFSCVPNGTYTIIADAPVKIWGGFNSQDITNIKQKLAFFITYVPIQKKAADVNLSNTVNTTDLTILKQKGAFFDPPQWLVKNYVFENPQVIINGADAILDFLGLCAADVNGSYTPVQ